VNTGAATSLIEPCVSSDRSLTIIKGIVTEEYLYFKKFDPVLRCCGSVPTYNFVADPDPDPTVHFYADGFSVQFCKIRPGKVA
jgi:hypothetical protein